MKLLVLIIALGIAYCSPSYAVNCGKRVVDIGDRQDKVVNKCGEPESTGSHKKYVAVSYIDPRTNLAYIQNEEVIIDEWIYNFGPLRYKQLLRFENGVLKEIQSLERGD